MTTSNSHGSRIVAILLSSVFALTLTLFMTSCGGKASELPLEASFGAGVPGDNSGPYAVTLTNTSDTTLAVAATITFSVQSHNRPQTMDLPAQEIAPGDTLVIDDLAAADQIVLTADGYAPMELTTPSVEHPLEASFGEGTPGENSGPYAVTLTNTSDEELVVAATVTFSVQSHNRPQTKILPPQTIAAGGTWTIDDLAAEDGIVLVVEGYAPLELTTPSGE